MKGFTHLKQADPDIYAVIKNELKRQEENLEMIASENFTSLAVMETQASVLTNKYAEGYSGARWYGGCGNVDTAEDLAISRAKELFGAEYVNVQPHSGTQANMAVYMAALKPKDTILALDLACGGHLSHGHAHNFSGMFYNIATYGVDRKTEMLDYDNIMQLAKKHKPKLVLAGASAYPRELDFKKFRSIADAVGAYLMVDMAHIAGLVAAGVHPSPVAYADFITSTTHKTLRGPRGGFILSKKEFAKKLNSRVFPGLQGGPLMHVIAAKAVAFKEALLPEFKAYQKQVVLNSRELAASLEKLKFRIVAGGTDTHLMLVDLNTKNITGSDASGVLEEANITVNKNLIPYDQKSPAVTSGIRLGTPSLTTRKMKQEEMRLIAGLINSVIENKDDKETIKKIRGQVLELAKRFPLYPQLG
ncbi:MAG: serine hydroxymethyltransferase [Candidatus Omnitrophica bacterium]|jgi:glycine hydroxymethyltransferase|nr:serine hydroxymethyltransferase [Candidatus Omnitrophota bacterium]